MEIRYSNRDLEAIDMLRIMLNDEDFLLLSSYIKEYEWKLCIDENDDMYEDEFHLYELLEFSKDIREIPNISFKPVGKRTEFGEILDLKVYDEGDICGIQDISCYLAFPISHFVSAQYMYVLLDTNP